MSEYKNVILCNKYDYISLRCGEYLSSRHDGKDIAISEDISQGTVTVYDDCGFEESIGLSD